MGNDAVDFLRRNLVATIEDLAEAARIFREPGRQRDGAKAALAAVLAFLHAFPEIREDNLDLPLAMLGRALADLDRGYVEPILAKAPVDSRPARIDMEFLRGYAAAAAELMRRAGTKTSEAHAQVAARLDAAGYRRDGSGGRITEATVEAWRKQASDRHAKDRGALLYRKTVNPENVSDAGAAAETTLKILDDWRPEKGR